MSLRRESDPAMTSWIEAAKAVPVAEALSRFGNLKRVGRQLEGPCPTCGGKTRLWADAAKNKWGCRNCQTGGGNALSLLMHEPGARFLDVCAELAGPPPKKLAAETETERAARLARMADAKARREAEGRAREVEMAARMARERARAHAIFEEARPVQVGDMAWLYWQFRRLGGVTPADIRCHQALDYWHDCRPEGAKDAAPDWRVVHTGPAMVAAARGRGEIITGCHITWLDPALAGFDASKVAAKGKAVILHPLTGETLPAKKMRGETWGSAIWLTPPCRFMLAGEGIETTRTALSAFDGRADVGAAVAMSLGHLSAMPIVTGAAYLFLGDGDSHPGETQKALRAACAHALAEGAERASLSMAPAGHDFNDLVMA